MKDKRRIWKEYDEEAEQAAEEPESGALKAEHKISLSAMFVHIMGPSRCKYLTQKVRQ